MSNAERQARWRERRDSELQRLRAEVAKLRKEVAELRAGAASRNATAPAVPPQAQQRPLNVGDALYTVFHFSRDRLSDTVVQAIISRISVVSVFFGFSNNGRPYKARVALDELLATGAAGRASASDGRIWLRDRGDDPQAAALRVQAFRITKAVRKLRNLPEAIAAARLEVQRTHPDKGGDVADFRKAKAKLDRLMGRKRK